MARLRLSGALALAALLAVPSCKCSDPQHSAPPAASSAPVVASVPPAPARVPRAVNPLPGSEPVKIAAADGVEVHGQLFVGGPADAPAVILVHRLAGARSEWEPLLQRIFPAKHPMNVLTIDLRGHGETVTRAGSKAKLAWHTFKPDDYQKIPADVTAAMSFMDKRKGGPPKALVLLGSDLGANAAVSVAADALPRLLGVGVVSAGAAIRGIELYKPYGPVRKLPNLIITTDKDNVSISVALALSKMSRNATLVRYEGAAHGAQFLGSQHPLAWDDMADWIEARLASAHTKTDAGPAGSAAPGGAASR